MLCNMDQPPLYLSLLQIAQIVIIAIVGSKTSTVASDIYNNTAPSKTVSGVPLTLDDYRTSLASAVEVRLQTCSSGPCTKF